MLESQQRDVRMLEQVLEKANLPAVVSSVDNADEVLFAAEDEAMDIAVLNLELPGVDDTIVEELRMLEGSKRLPIIAFSDSEPEEADHVFPKPREDYEYFGIVHAIRIYWMARAPSLAPPPPDTPSDRPRRLSGIDLMGLPIKPVEAYLLSMVDGQMDIEEISLSMGTEAKETRAMLRRLAELGAVAWRPPHPSLAPPEPTLAFTLPLPELDSKAPEAEEPPIVFLEQREAIAPEPPSEPEPKPETKPEQPEPTKATKTLTPERKKIIDDAHALLGETDHYELLGVPRDAGKKAIRDAYFKLAKLFHTDTLFGVELADYGPKMDKVFRDLTEAYDVLSKNKKRRAYDAYLDAVRETKPLDESPTPSLAPPAPDSEAEAQPDAEAQAEAEAEAEAEATEREPRPRSDEASRRKMARELLEKRIRRPASRPRQEQQKEGAVQALTRTLQAVSQSSAKEDRATRLIADAVKAEQAGNITGAAEALRIAAAWRPNDEVLARKAEELRLRALEQKAPAYEKRAKYAERNDNWEEAALCWMKVCEVRKDDAEASMAAARALTKARGDLKEAALYAKRATELRPKLVDAHLVLAEVFVAAGMPASASRSLKTVLQISPNNAHATQLLEELES